MASRRHFLRLIAATGVAALLPTPVRALGASRPPLHLFFPQDPLVTWFLPTYGQIKADGHRHLGIDLMAPKLSPVYAVKDGEVTRAGQSPRAGRHLIIQHDQDWESWYLHLNNDDPGSDNGNADWALTLVPGIEEGSVVKTGEHIGFVGDSGNAEWTESHTHFELHLARRTVNPYPYLVEAQTEALNTANAKIIQSICNPAAGQPSVDGFVCPLDPNEVAHIPSDISQAL